MSHSAPLKLAMDRQTTVSLNEQPTDPSEYTKKENEKEAPVPLHISVIGLVVGLLSCAALLFMMKYFVFSFLCALVAIVYGVTWFIFPIVEARDGSKRIVKLMKAHKTQKRIQLECCQALYKIASAKQPSTSRSQNETEANLNSHKQESKLNLIDNDAIDGVIQATADFPNNPEICSRAFAVLNCLLPVNDDASTVLRNEEEISVLSHLISVIDTLHSLPQIAKHGLVFLSWLGDVATSKLMEKLNETENFQAGKKKKNKNNNNNDKSNFSEISNKGSENESTEGAYVAHTDLLALIIRLRLAHKDNAAVAMWTCVATFNLSCAQENGKQNLAFRIISSPFQMSIFVSTLKQYPQSLHLQRAGLGLLVKGLAGVRVRSELLDVGSCLELSVAAMGYHTEDEQMKHIVGMLMAHCARLNASERCGTPFSSSSSSTSQAHDVRGKQSTHAQLTDKESSCTISDACAATSTRNTDIVVDVNVDDDVDTADGTFTANASLLQHADVYVAKEKKSVSEDGGYKSNNECDVIEFDTDDCKEGIREEEEKEEACEEGRQENDEEDRKRRHRENVINQFGGFIPTKRNNTLGSAA